MAEKISDEKRINDYLTRLMSGKFFKVEDLDKLTVTDLTNDTPLQDIDAVVLEKTLEDFRQNYKSEIFEDQ